MFTSLTVIIVVIIVVVVVTIIIVIVVVENSQRMIIVIRADLRKHKCSSIVSGKMCVFFDTSNKKGYLSSEKR